MSPRERQRLLYTLAGAAVLVVVAIAYRPALDAVFVGEDHGFLSPDAKWRSATLDGLFRHSLWPDNPLSEIRTSYYRPLVLATFRLDAALGDRPSEYHFTNVLAHVVACALLAVVARRLGAKPAAAVLGSLVWGLAPRLTETVTWVASRADVLAGALSLSALALAPDVSEGRPWRAWPRSVLAGLALFSALASKEIALAAALAIFVAAVVPRDGDGRRERIARLVRLVPTLALPIGVYLALRIVALSGATSSHREADLPARVGLALEATGRYAAMTLDAWRPQTSIGMFGEISTPYAALGAAILAGLAALAWRTRLRVSPGVAVGAALAIGATLPVLHLVPISLAGAVVADRYLYLPLAGIVIVASVLARRLSGRPALVAGALVLGASVLSARVTRQRSGEYADETRFWITAAETAHPHNTSPRTWVAGLVREWGPVELGCRVFDSVRAIQESAGYAGSPRHRRTRESLATCWTRIGRSDEAKVILDDILAAYPNSGRARLSRALVYMQRMEFDAAAAEYRAAASSDPSLEPQARRALSAFGDARADAQKFATEEAQKADPIGWARQLARVGRFRDAEQIWVVVATDPSARIGHQREARAGLVHTAPAPIAKRAYEAIPDLDDTHTLNTLKRRVRRWEEVTRQLPRIERLASPP